MAEISQIQPANSGTALAEKKRLSKNQWRRQKAKQKKSEQKESHQQQQNGNNQSNTQASEEPNSSGDSENLTEDRDVVPGTSKLFETEIDIALNDPRFAHYKEILDKFHTEEGGETHDNGNDGSIFYSDDDDAGSESDDDSDKAQKLSKKKLKAMSKLSLVELKSLAPKPELVEWFDADSPDPLLVVEIKVQRGVVPVPDHWLIKREYLSSKRGIKKAPFDLPSYIKDTGIMEMRNSLKEDESSLRQKARERVQPKMGKLDIDYAKLHNAFFKFQTKPRLYKFGELYYEGKEAEMNLDNFRPGKLSPRLVEALNIPPNAPPPWLLNMQRYGPPPNYPGLKIPGLNAPIPPGAQWGFQPGGYGRPPLDEHGKPLYGDVYGLTQVAEKTNLGNPIERAPWGQFFQEESEEEDEEEDEDEDEDDTARNADFDEGAGYVDGESAEARENVAAAEPPELELRKNIPKESESSEKPKELFQVLKENSSSSAGFMGSHKSYDLPGTKKVC